MTRTTTTAFCLSVAMLASVSPAALAAPADRIAARLDALERENAALRARVMRLESPRAARAEPAAAMASAPRGGKVWKADPAVTERRYAPRYEISGSLLFLKPGSGNLEYGTLTSPFPLVSPSWQNQSLTPSYKAAFDVGARFWTGDVDIGINWTRLRSSTDGSFAAEPNQMVGPPFLVGPESFLYKRAAGSAQTEFDAVNLDVGYNFCSDCMVGLRTFAGVQYARIGQNVTGTFQNPAGTVSMSNTTNSLFTGIGPRVGLRGDLALGQFEFIGELAAAALIGTEKSSLAVTTINTTMAGPNNQSLTSPDSTRVVPSMDAKVAAAYKFAPSDYGQFRVELGYRASVYFDAVSRYEITQVPTSLTLPPNGIYLSTQDHVRSNFTSHGPYLTASWLFGH
ncbi:MAG: Lpg1974 family pore-forming outer membrane protein [Pseudolabrys sp.]|nr:Lpg1974 family pore-forming outer membrane protein [Pseudolabrys sp.]